VNCGFFSKMCVSARNALTESERQSGLTYKDYFSWFFCFVLFLRIWMNAAASADSVSPWYQNWHHWDSFLDSSSWSQLTTTEPGISWGHLREDRKRHCKAQSFLHTNRPLPISPRLELCHHHPWLQGGREHRYIAF
jgi:hypothetical protein